MKKKTTREPILYRVLRPLLVGMFKLLYKPSIIGRQHIPSEGGAVLAGNHSSNLDCFILAAATGRCVHFMAKDELFKGPARLFFNGIGAIPVNRRTRDVHSLVAAERELEAEKLVAIFPEGTINRTDKPVMPFKPGAVKMAADTGKKIVPFTIKGEYKLFDRGAKIIFYPPIEVNGEDLRAENRRLMELVSTALQTG